MTSFIRLTNSCCFSTKHVVEEKECSLDAIIARLLLYVSCLNWKVAKNNDGPVTVCRTLINQQQDIAPLLRKQSLHAVNIFPQYQSVTIRRFGAPTFTLTTFFLCKPRHRQIFARFTALVSPFVPFAHHFFYPREIDIVFGMFVGVWKTMGRKKTNFGGWKRVKGPAKL